VAVVVAFNAVVVGYVVSQSLDTLYVWAFTAATIANNASPETAAKLRLLKRRISGPFCKKTQRKSKTRGKVDAYYLTKPESPIKLFPYSEKKYRGGSTRRANALRRERPMAGEGPPEIECYWRRTPGSPAKTLT
jgi:hypothetical protein